MDSGIENYFNNFKENLYFFSDTITAKTFQLIRINVNAQPALHFRFAITRINNYTLMAVFVKIHHMYFLLC